MRRPGINEDQRAGLADVGNIERARLRITLTVGDRRSVKSRQMEVNTTIEDQELETDEVFRHKLPTLMQKHAIEATFGQRK